MTNREPQPLFTAQDVDDLFNAVDVLRNMHRNGHGDRVRGICAKYAHGTPGYVRAASLYKKIEHLIDIGFMTHTTLFHPIMDGEPHIEIETFDG